MNKAFSVTLPAMALLAGMAVAPQAARADGGHLYSAQSCQGYAAADRAAALIYNVAGVRNTSTTTRQLSCPMNLASNDPITQPPIDFDYMWAWVNDRSTAAGFNCQPAVKDNTGAFWYGPTTTTSASGTSAADEVLLWANPFNGGNAFPYTITMSHMRCYLPGSNSDLISINSSLQ